MSHFIHQHMSFPYMFFGDHQSALKYLKDTEANIWNILIMASNFNIRNNDWDSSYPFHSTHSDTLLKIANSFDLSLFSPVQQVSTQYSNNNNNTNSVIDLFFLWLNSIEIDNHIILPELWYPSNHASLTIAEELIQNKGQTIIRNSEEEENFIKAIRNINTTTILDKDALENTVQGYARISETIWYKHLKYVNITR